MGLTEYFWYYFIMALKKHIMISPRIFSHTIILSYPSATDLYRIYRIFYLYNVSPMSPNNTHDCLENFKCLLPIDPNLNGHQPSPKSSKVKDIHIKQVSNSLYLHSKHIFLECRTESNLPFNSFTKHLPFRQCPLQ